MWPMSEDDEERIRERAYLLWEEEGRPFGRAVDHWLLAAREVADINIGKRLAPLSPGHVDPLLEQTDGPDKIPLYP